VFEQKTTNASLNFFCAKANKQVKEAEVEAEVVAAVAAAAATAAEAVVAVAAVAAATTVGAVEAEAVVMAATAATTAAEVAADAAVVTEASLAAVAETDTEEKTEADACIYIRDIYNWQASCEKAKGILIRTQTESDGCARTFEEAILYQYIKYKCANLIGEQEAVNAFTVFTPLIRANWGKIREKCGFVFSLPNRRKDDDNEKKIELDNIERCIREIVRGISDNKSDFMYSIIMANAQYSVLPVYIKEGLEWLAQK
jgi:hypothetical protein